MPREISQLERNGPKPIAVKRSENIQGVLNIIDHMIAGKRFGEMDSAKQMFLLGCQAKIDEMQHGYFTEEGLLFLNDTIDTLMENLIAAKNEIKIFIRSEENESDDKYADEPVEEKKLLEKK